MQGQEGMAFEAPGRPLRDEHVGGVVGGADTQRDARTSAAVGRFRGSIESSLESSDLRPDQEIAAEEMMRQGGRRGLSWGFLENIHTIIGRVPVRDVTTVEGCSQLVLATT